MVLSISMKDLFKRFLVKSALFVVLGTVFFSGYYVLVNKLAISFSSYWFPVLFIILTISYFDSLNRFFMGLIYKVLPGQGINYAAFLKNFSGVLMTIVDVDKLSSVVVNTLYEFYELTSASIFLFDEKKKNYALIYQCGKEIDCDSISKNEGIVDYLKSTHGILIRNRCGKSEEHLNCRRIMETVSSYLCIPLLFKDNLLGFVFLGRKRSGHDYTAEDEESFFTLESQMSVAFNNAILFKAQKEAHVLLAQKNKMDAIIALSSGINHEINNPLSIISMRCQNFLRKVASGKFITASEVVRNAQEVIESSLRNANRAHLITKRLASFAKPVQEEMELQPVTVKDCIKECIDLIGKKQFFSDNIVINMEIPDSIPQIYADRVHFQQVLYNMIMNAYHSIEKNGTITFRTYEKGSRRIVLEIEDTGCGIEEENLDKIWEPFFTTKPTNPVPGSKATGSGLGLALVRRYIESSGGSLNVKSVVGKGTTFYINLVKVVESERNKQSINS